MNNLFQKKILLIICGGISAYKSLELIRLLKKQGVEIKTILTKSAKKFVTPLSIASLSKGKVYDDLFNSENEVEMDHISLSRWADIILVAPATANTISKLSAGSSDNLASTVILASDKDIFLTPAMNVRMWNHPSTKENLNKLKSFGYKIIGPVIGDMACGEFGEGKMTEPNEILNEILNYFNQLNKNKKFKALVTAGPTYEYIDPVRFITNKSSGKQGFALATSLAKKGFETTLISGPTNLKMWSPWSNDVRKSADLDMPIQTYSNITIFQADMKCVACGKAGCNDSGVSECLNYISPSIVFKEVDNWYKNERL